MIPRLFYITDGARGTGGRPQAEVIAKAARGGLEAVVLRLGRASAREWTDLVEALLPLRGKGLRVLASRRLDVARAWQLDGVQLAADSASVAQARGWLGPQALIGYSAHDGQDAAEAARQGASFVTLSPIYPTASKPGAPGRGLSWLARASAGLDIPVLALGGVTPERTAESLSAGAWGVAVVSAIGAAPDPEAAASDFTRILMEDRR